MHTYGLAQTYVGLCISGVLSLFFYLFFFTFYPFFHTLFYVLYVLSTFLFPSVNVFILGVRGTLLSPKSMNNTVMLLTSRLNDSVISATGGERPL